MKKIDFHCHTTRSVPKHLVSEVADIPAIENLMNKFDVEQTVLIATYFPEKGTGISNFRMYDWIRDSPNIHLFGSLDFGTFYRRDLNELEELAERRIAKGIKVYSGYQDIDYVSDKFSAVLAVARKHGIPVMFHSGYTYVRGEDRLPDDCHPDLMRRLAQDNPNNIFVASHMANPHIGALIDATKACPNIYVDTSGLINSKSDRKDIPDCIEMIRKYLEECGSSRLLFGTDFPVQTHEDSIYIVEQAMEGFAAVDKRAVYYDNAQRLLYG